MSSYKEVFRFFRRRSKFSRIFDNCTVDPVSMNVDFVSETDGAESKLLFADKPGEKSTITSVREKKLFFTGFVCSEIYTVSSDDAILKRFYSANRTFCLTYYSSWKCSHDRRVNFDYYSAGSFRVFSLIPMKHKYRFSFNG